MTEIDTCCAPRPACASSTGLKFARIQKLSTNSHAVPIFPCAEERQKNLPFQAGGHSGAVVANHDLQAPAAAMQRLHPESRRRLIRGGLLRVLDQREQHLFELCGKTETSQLPSCYRIRRYLVTGCDTKGMNATMEVPDDCGFLRPENRRPGSIRAPANRRSLVLATRAKRVSRVSRSSHQGEKLLESSIAWEWVYA